MLVAEAGIRAAACNVAAMATAAAATLKKNFWNFELQNFLFPLTAYIIF